MTDCFNGSLPELVHIQSNGVQVMTAQQQLAFINAQYMEHIMRASIILMVYALYNFFFMMPRIKERTLKNIVFFHANTVAVVMSLYLFVVSLVYQGWLKI